MKTLRTRLALAAAIAVPFVLPASATAAEEEVVPPSNSAATQYTEALPTSGGGKKTDETNRHRSPGKVLGTHKAHKLESRGPEGRAVAKTAAETAPASIGTAPPASAPSAPNVGAGKNVGSADQSKGGGGTGAPGPSDHAKGGAAPSEDPGPAGSSGIGEAIGQATGLSSTGTSGPLLALAILATALWSVAYLWRRRRQFD